MIVLDAIVAAARERAKQLPKGQPAGWPRGVPLDDALRGKERLKLIAEYKRSSPAAGPIAAGRDVVEQVRGYVRAGAAAVSVLTEPSQFGGSLEDLERAAAAVTAPVLMKDFVVDVAQVRVAACLGARGVLLIARILSPAELEELASACAHYGLVPLIECHDEDEVARALAVPRAVLGLNNRDLTTLAVDRGRAIRLLETVPRERVVVAESGYERPEEAAELRGRADAVLVGTALMRAADPEAWIREATR